MSLEKNHRIEFCLDKLKEVLIKPIAFSGSFIRPVSANDNNPIESDMHKVKTHLKSFDGTTTDYFGYIHKWFSASPQKQVVIDRGNELYVNNITIDEQCRQYPPDRVANNLLNENENPSNRQYNIEKILESEKSIVVEGRKGIGKTTFFNYWLNNRTQFLENEKKKLWFRVDVSKLYGIWDSLSRTEKDPFSIIGLEQYHKVHTIYVVAKYGRQGRESKALCAGWDRVNRQACQEGRLKAIVDVIDAAIADTISVPDGKGTERFFDCVMKSGVLDGVCQVYDLCHQYIHQRFLDLLQRD